MKRSDKDKLLREVWESGEYSQYSDAEIRDIYFKNPALVKLLNYSKEAKKILECGCGDGRILKILWRKDAGFYGVDLSKRAVSNAKKRFKGKRNVYLKAGDVEGLKFPKSHFDFV